MARESQPSAPRKHFRMLGVSSDKYPPQRVDVAVLFGEELAGRGHRIDWILQSEKACARSYIAQWGGGNVWVGATDLGTSLLRRLRKHVLGIMHDTQLGPLARGDNYDLILAKDKFIAAIFALIAARLFGKRFVYWLSYPFPEASLLGARDGTARYPILYWIRGICFSVMLYRILLPAADHIFVQSEEMRRNVIAKGAAASKTTVVLMGVRVESFAALSGVERRMIPAGERCFLYLGALDNVRRLGFIIRVLAAVAKELPDVRLYLVGSADDPRDEQDLLDEAERLGVRAAVALVGQLPQAEALRYVAEADVCVSPIVPTPILNAGSPTKLIEYMAMGKAVVANDHPEQRLVIEASGAGYCVPYEEEAFAQAVVALLRAPELARAMGERGRVYAAEHRGYGSIADLVERELLKLAQS
jgi:glycosyltransferase involved in cell wall biosynthesis